MIRIEAIFKDNKTENQYACITNQMVIPGVWAKCLFCFFVAKENKWFLSWNKSNVQQLLKNERNGANKRINHKEVPSELLDMIQQEIDKANKKEEKTVKQISKGF